MGLHEEAELEGWREKEVMGKKRKEIQQEEGRESWWEIE